MQVRFLPRTPFRMSDVGFQTSDSKYHRSEIRNLISDIRNGPLAQLARALPWHGRGQGFKSLMVHKSSTWNIYLFYMEQSNYLILAKKVF